MTEKFDRLITEILQNYRHVASRYDKKNGLSSDVRNFRNMSNFSPSQRTKLGNQQYIGNISRPRVNRTKKSSEEIHLARGIGSYVNLDSEKSVGSSVNSKQGNMEVKRNLGNGRYRVGPKNPYKQKHD